MPARALKLDKLCHPMLSVKHRLESEYIPSLAIMDAIESAIKEVLSKYLSRKLGDDILLKIVDRSEDSGIIPLEDGIIKGMPEINPLTIFKGKNVVGVDGGAFSLRLHPFRVIIARTAVFGLSMRNNETFGAKDVWRFSVSIIRRRGGVPEQVRRKVRDILMSLETVTIRELAEEYGSVLDVVFWDGPIISRRYFKKFYSAIKSLVDRAIICIKIVKNPFSTWLSGITNVEALTDADLLSMYLPPNTRTIMFLYDNKLVNGVPYYMKPVFFYVKTKGRVVFRYEFPYCVLEEYGKDQVLEIISADLQLGNGFSYVIGRADKIARFCDEEKRYIAFRVLSAFKKCGIADILMYNQLRWGRYLYRWGQA